MDFFVNFSLQRTLTVGNSTHFALICTSSLCGIHKKLFNMENCTKKIKISSYNEYLISFSTKSWKNTKRAINIFFHFPQNLGRMEKVVVMENIVESAYFSFFILPRFCWKLKKIFIIPLYFCLLFQLLLLWILKLDHRLVGYFFQSRKSLVQP